MSKLPLRESDIGDVMADIEQRLANDKKEGKD